VGADKGRSAGNQNFAILPHFLYLHYFCEKGQFDFAVSQRNFGFVAK